MPDYEALRGETGGLPPDGVHDAYLDGARLADTRVGEMLWTDWRTVSDPLYQWSTGFRFDGQGLGFTLDFLDGIGVDRSSLAEVYGSRLEDALDARLGQVFTIRTKRWGDTGVNVTVLERAAPQQESLDLPIDPVEPEPVSAGADEDVPF
jgi:hypothetical protein